ncbi:MAG TPA: hypothetical protein VEJ84_07350, partial [Acidimicrobiales bacterium]|nr:hypothetical protein [Acidimicrobiales bacterium]
MKTRQSLWIVVLATVLGATTVAVAGHQTVAVAVVPLQCPGGDYRTSADKLPRPGVVVVHQYTYLPPSYSTYTINNAGKLTSISTSRPSSDIPIVSVWENGTNCSGSEISRNAWAVTPEGQVYGDSTYSGPPAANYGGMAGTHLNKPIVGMSPTSTGRGYWLVASDGGIFSFGDARFYGSTGNIRLNKPIVGMSVTPSGKGYWMVATDGGIFSFGDAKFYGSTGNIRLNKPITGMTATPSGQGYWMVASDGGIFAFGDAKFYGSMGGQHLSAPIAGMIPNSTGGYTLIGEDGQIYPFGPTTTPPT